MTDREEIVMTLERAVSGTLGASAATVVEAAVAQADAAGLDDLQVATRIALVRESSQNNREWAGLAPFLWLTARHAQRPDLFDDDDKRFLLLYYRWAIGVAGRNPEVGIGEMRMLEAGMVSYLTQAGVAEHVIHNQHAVVSRYLGRRDEARAHIARWRATPRDPGIDCPWCDSARAVLPAVWDDDAETAVRLAAPVLAIDESSAATCGWQPSDALAYALCPLLESGRPRAAWDAHLRSFAAHRLDPSQSGWMREHLSFLALSGRVARGLAVIRQRGHWPSRCESAYDLRELLLGAALVLREAVAHGGGEEPMGVDVPTHPLWAPGAPVRATDTLAVAHEAVTAWVHRLDTCFDQRNGNTTYSEESAAHLSRPAHRTGHHPLVLRVEPLVDAEPMPEPLNASDVEPPLPSDPTALRLGPRRGTPQQEAALRAGEAAVNELLVAAHSSPALVPFALDRLATLCEDYEDAGRDLEADDVRGLMLALAGLHGVSDGTGSGAAGSVAERVGTLVG